MLFLLNFNSTWHVPNKVLKLSTILPVKLFYILIQISYIFSTGYLANDGKLAAEIDQNYKLLFPILLSYLWDTKAIYLDYISQILRLHYFGYREIGAETAHEMTEVSKLIPKLYLYEGNKALISKKLFVSVILQFFTHGMFGISIIKAIRSYPGPKHVYWYDYKSNYTRQNIIGYFEEDLGKLFVHVSMFLTLLCPGEIRWIKLKIFHCIMSSEFKLMPHRKNDQIKIRYLLSFSCGRGIHYKLKKNYTQLLTPPPLKKYTAKISVSFSSNFL